MRREALERVSNFKDKIVEIRDTTKKACASLVDESIDLAYIDGDHTLRGITIDLVSILPKIKRGGFIGGDDFTKTIWQHGTSYDPTEVFPFAIYFAEAHDLTIYTLPFHQFLIVNDAKGFDVKDYAGYTQLTPRQIYVPPKIGFARRMFRILPANARGRLKAILHLNR
ncbi:class I SAM-dependent methyltransferase [Tateyamaria sp.]|uniref:class I SAM-dependent methyltransferase n=1 Tax=Tateyamaria sp. TaxID=1929288 RepID=UPI00329DFA6A